LKDSSVDVTKSRGETWGVFLKNQEWPEVSGLKVINTPVKFEGSLEVCVLSSSSLKEHEAKKLV
jgi:hypothetical protein